ncbi:MAG: HAD family hydrolase [Candidatus Aminicenantes bacterium]|nr:HAD family hydrolase [Candidatus Aminicenantes bacterium]MDH5713932.1 HAD family hydrolase [Candidatus Aminicenantes bacterium]
MFEGIIFDLDGTVTKPYIDFPELKRKIGIPPDQLILEHMATLEGAQLERADRILEDCEREAAENSVLNDHFREVWSYLKKQGIKTAILTRNSRTCVDMVMRKHRLSFDLVVTREDAPPKPSEAPVLLISQRLSIPPDKLLLIGDVKYDIWAGKAAGVKTVLLTNGKEPDPSAGADWTINSFHELIPILEKERQKQEG